MDLEGLSSAPHITRIFGHSGSSKSSSLASDSSLENTLASLSTSAIHKSGEIVGCNTSRKDTFHLIERSSGKPSCERSATTSCCSQEPSCSHAFLEQWVAGNLAAKSGDRERFSHCATFTLTINNMYL